MELTKCSICLKQIMPTDRIIRVTVEDMSSGSKSNVDPSYFSKTHAWNVLSVMHKTCIALSEGREIPYENEVRSLGNIPKLRVVV